VSGPFRLVIPRAIYVAILAHARAELPAECCGLLAGKVEEGVGRVTQHFPLVNALASPTEFESEPMSRFAAHKAMRAAGTDILGVYHSHPTTDPIPSDRDRERSYDDQVVNIIIGLRRAEPEVRGWWLTADGAHEATWEIEADQQ
jgi:[CysO sulfur-carrier protein]-S-L-cysteine hydrolase